MENGAVTRYFEKLLNARKQLRKDKKKPMTTGEKIACNHETTSINELRGNYSIAGQEAKCLAHAIDRAVDRAVRKALRETH